MFKEGDKVVLNTWDKLTRGRIIGIPKEWFDDHCGDEFTVIDTLEFGGDIQIYVKEVRFWFSPDALSLADSESCHVDESLTDFLISIM